MGPKIYVKYRHFPGDIPKQHKILLLEKGLRKSYSGGEEEVPARVKKFRNNYIRSRERAVLKRRFAKLIKNETYED